MKIKLLKYEIHLQFSPGKEMYVADLLSRSFLKDKVKDDSELSEVVHSVEKHLSIASDKRKQFEKETEKDNDLKIILDYCKEGWPNLIKKVPGSLRVYWSHQSLISEQNGLQFLNDRFIVPNNLVDDMLRLLHISHMGMTKTKLRAKCNLFCKIVKSL